MDSGIFQAWERTVGARVLSHLRGLGVLSLVCASFLDRRKRGRAPESEGTAWYEIQDHSLAVCLPPEQLPETLFPTKVLPFQATGISLEP